MQTPAKVVEIKRGSAHRVPIEKKPMPGSVVKPKIKTEEINN